MFRNLLAFSSACLLAGNLLHAEQLRWDKPVQEFHRSPQDKFVETKFSFKNTGTTPVKIDDIRTSCGCTTADLTKRTYAPGEQGEITVKFNFGGRTGGLRKVIRVFSSDKPDEPTPLDLIVYVEEPLKVAPALVLWRVGEANTPKPVEITATPEHPVRIKGVSSSNPRLAASLRTVKAGEEYLVSVKPTDTTLRESAEISVQTDYPPDAPRAYTIHARIK
ncbi:DUF1573 domain-containing protein [Verrucomicrobiota bacterium sgz303538]